MFSNDEICRIRNMSALLQLSVSEKKSHGAIVLAQLIVTTLGLRKIRLHAPNKPAQNKICLEVSN
jgi:hypothetical protein